MQEKTNVKMVKAQNIFEAIRKLRGTHYEADFIPRVGLPTLFEPGTAEKVDVIMERLERGEALFHPDDNTIFDGCTRYVRPSKEGDTYQKREVRLDRFMRRMFPDIESL